MIDTTLSVPMTRPQKKNGAPMSDAEKDTAHPPVNVHVKFDEVSRLTVGTRWEVVASSRDSLFDEGAYTVMLKEIETEGEGE
jgi:hypothetical protein